MSHNFPTSKKGLSQDNSMRQLDFWLRKQNIFDKFDYYRIVAEILDDARKANCLPKYTGDVPLLVDELRLLSLSSGVARERHWKEGGSILPIPGGCRA